MLSKYSDLAPQALSRPIRFHVESSSFNIPSYLKAIIQAIQLDFSKQCFGGNTVYTSKILCTRNFNVNSGVPQCSNCRSRNRSQPEAETLHLGYLVKCSFKPHSRS